MEEMTRPVHKRNLCLYRHSLKETKDSTSDSQHLSTGDAVVLLWLGKGMAEVGNDLFSMLSFFCVNWCNGLAMVAKVLTNQ